MNRLVPLALVVVLAGAAVWLTRDRPATAQEQATEAARIWLTHASTGNRAGMCTVEAEPPNYAGSFPAADGGTIRGAWADICPRTWKPGPTAKQLDPSLYAVAANLGPSAIELWDGGPNLFLRYSTGNVYVMAAPVDGRWRILGGGGGPGRLVNPGV